LNTGGLLAILLAVSAAAHRAEGEPARIGVLQPQPARAAQLADAGITLAVLSVSWDRFEPAAGAHDSGYIQELRADLGTMRRAGQEIVLDPGVQYPPAWLFNLSECRYRNQYGDVFVDVKPGMNIANSVFNAKVREIQAAYMGSLFKALGTEFFAVRLGGGWYGELNYPSADFKNRKNCYWGFDAIAQGAAPGLPHGLVPCPVPGWQPGIASPDNRDARRFLEWYLGSLQNYHDWQITTIRRFYAGPLMMMYPSWGIRPGQIEAAVSGDLSGGTPPEKNGEIQRGFDFARFIGGIRDPGVWVHCTWLDSNPAWSDETSADPARWSPAHYLSSLAAKHSPPLHLSAENTGGGGARIPELCFRRVRDLNFRTMFWAFAPDLFDGEAPELHDLGAAIKANNLSFP
jgi:hypothetical protein